MNDSQTIKVHDDLDIITARLLVRKLARARGFDIADQARISLAASSLVYTLGLERVHRGQIIIDCLSDGARTGIRVVYTKADGAIRGLNPEALDDVRLMVDELSVERLPGDDLQVTLVKWPDNERGLSRPG
jgi:hypothetical protein